MKLEIDRTELVNALALAKKAIAGKTTRPILANVYMKAADDRLQIVATDMEQMVIVEKRACVERSGAITVPAKLMSDLCVTLPIDSLAPVLIELNESSKTLSISLDKSKYEINIMSVDDYPPVPNLSDLEMTEIKGSVLALALKQAGIACDIDDVVNPVHKVVYVDFTYEPIAVGTDSKRLAVIKINGFEAPKNMEQSYMIPIKAAKELSEMLKNADVAEMTMYNNQLVCRVEQITYLTRTVEGRFPAYQRVLPKESTSSVIVSRKELSRALKSLLPIARNCSNLVIYEFANDSLKLSANSPENGKAETKVDCKITGEAPKIGLNLQFVNDFLSCVDCDSVKMEMTTASYPILFIANDGDQKQVVMPMAY